MINSQEYFYNMSALNILFFGCLLALLFGKSQNNFN